MSSYIIFGAQWGDEGKGKIVDLLTRDVSRIVRFQGGNNAGHTVVAGDEKFILHLMPSGILHPHTSCLIGNGVVLDPEVFGRELSGLAARGVDTGPRRVRISRKTHVITPYHKELDKAREMARDAKTRIGTTGRGIGPCYEDKAARVGVRAGDFTNPELLRAKIEHALKEKNALFAMYGAPAMDADEVFDQSMRYGEPLVPYLDDVSSSIAAALDAGENVLFEGAQGVMLDIDHGTYPFVTSSNTVAGNAMAGAGLAMERFDRIIAIVKAYTTRVGSGPFATELFDAAGEHMQTTGAEFGSTTGRPRRCGWFDAVVLRESVRLCSPTEIALTKLDVLGGLEEINICVAYDYRGQRVKFPPQEQNGMADAAPVYETMPGWSQDIGAARRFEDLPGTARQYVERVEAVLGVKVSIISVGPDRDQTIMR